MKVEKGIHCFGCQADEDVFDFVARLYDLLVKEAGIKIADEDEHSYEALRLFMLGAISRAFKPGCKFEVMLCLVGGQGVGKSTFFHLLAVKGKWFFDDIRKLDDDNVYRKL